MCSLPFIKVLNTSRIRYMHFESITSPRMKHVVHWRKYIWKHFFSSVPFDGKSTTYGKIFVMIPKPGTSRTDFMCLNWKIGEVKLLFYLLARYNRTEASFIRSYSNQRQHCIWSCRSEGFLRVLSVQNFRLVFWKSGLIHRPNSFKNYLKTWKIRT